MSAFLLGVKENRRIRNASEDRRLWPFSSHEREENVKQVKSMTSLNHRRGFGCSTQSRAEQNEEDREGAFRASFETI